MPSMVLIAITMLENVLLTLKKHIDEGIHGTSIPYSIQTPYSTVIKRKKIYVIWSLNTEINKPKQIPSYFWSYFNTLGVCRSRCHLCLIHRIFTLSKAVVEYVVVGLVANSFSAFNDYGSISADVSLATQKCATASRHRALDGGERNSMRQT